MGRAVTVIAGAVGLTATGCATSPRVREAAAVPTILPESGVKRVSFSKPSRAGACATDHTLRSSLHQRRPRRVDAGQEAVGGMPFYVAGGAVVNYALVRRETGEVAAADIVSVLCGYRRVTKSPALECHIEAQEPTAAPSDGASEIAISEGDAP